MIRADQPGPSASTAGSWRRFAPVAAVIVLGFALPLWRLLDFAIHDELYSYIVLIPLVSAYMVWQDKGKTPATSPAAPGLAMIFLLGGVALLGWHLLSPTHAMEDSLAKTTLAFLLFMAAAASWRLGGQMLRTFAFAFGFLIFMVPMPVMVLDLVDSVLQQGSAVVAGILFNTALTPVVQDGLSFKLPGILLRVAPECSGIHSTMVLFITSLLAGYYFLDRPWKRAVICLAIIPLALLRNGFRIFVVGELCVHISPDMINSVIHRHGGPLFFLLSLIPFFYLIKYLRRSGRSAGSDQKDNLTK